MNKRIEKIISQMTLEEKIGQLTQEIMTNERMSELECMAENGELGSCILANSAFAGNTEQEVFLISKLNELQKVAVEKSRFGIPIIYGRDIIHGSRTIFPIPLAQAATWDYELIKEAASIMACEASYTGIHWTFAPMLDICCDPRWGRIIECPGEDPFLGQMYARASVDGIQGEDMSADGKLAACAKHFIGYGASQAGRDKDPTEWSDYTLRNRALPAFKEAINSGVATVMSAFNEVSGEPVTASRYYLTEILKEELAFDGFVISDWNAIQRLECQGVSDNDEHSAILAINAGVDMDMVDGLYKNYLKKAVDKGLVSIETIDEAVKRILRIKFKLGLFDNPYNKEESINKFMTKDYIEKAKEVSEHSMVLLKNNGILPLSKETKVILSGPMAEEKGSLLGSWYAGGRDIDVVSLAEGICKVNGEEYTFVCSNDSKDKYELINMSDICVVALGEDREMTGEGRTMPNIEISQSQVAYVKKAKEAGKKVIAVIFAGRPLAITEILPYCDAILWAWHGGTMCGIAAAEIIFGDFNPCGKLPITIPRCTGQIPICYNHNRNELVLSGYYNNEPYISTTELSNPLYVFGYGLSYTTFKYCNFDYKFNSNEGVVEVEFDIENIGKHDGYEIAQCYVSDLVASMSRPIKELKAFEKVFVEKGKKKHVKFVLDKDKLSFYNNRAQFIFEEGNFKIEVGKSCNEICYETIQNISF